MLRALDKFARPYHATLYGKWSLPPHKEPENTNITSNQSFLNQPPYKLTVTGCTLKHVH